MHEYMLHGLNLRSRSTDMLNDFAKKGWRVHTVLQSNNANDLVVLLEREVEAKVKKAKKVEKEDSEE